MTDRRQLTVHHAARVRIPAGSGTELAALDTGLGADPGGRPTVVLVPGYTGSKEDFAPLLDPLADNGFRAIAVDLPGQYESPGPDDETAYGCDVLGAMLASMLTAHQDPVVLIGHSFGGLVGRAAVLAGARPAGLVLLDSGPGALPDGPRRLAMQIGEPVLREQGARAAYAIREDLTSALRGSGDEDLAAFLRTRFVASSPAGLLGMAAALIGEPDRVDDLAAALRTGGTEVAVISGEADDAWGLEQQADMARRLGSTLVAIPGAAHSPAVEQPDRLLRILLRLLRAWTAGRTLPTGSAVPPR